MLPLKYPQAKNVSTFYPTATLAVNKLVLPFSKKMFDYSSRLTLCDIIIDKIPSEYEKNLIRSPSITLKGKASDDRVIFSCPIQIPNESLAHAIELEAGIYGKTTSSFELAANVVSEAEKKAIMIQKNWINAELHLTNSYSIQIVEKIEKPGTTEEFALITANYPIISSRLVKNKVTTYHPCCLVITYNSDIRQIAVIDCLTEENRQNLFSIIESEGYLRSGITFYNGIGLSKRLVDTMWCRVQSNAIKKGMISFISNFANASEKEEENLEKDLTLALQTMMMTFVKNKPELLLLQNNDSPNSSVITETFPMTVFVNLLAMAITSRKMSATEIQRLQKVYFYATMSTIEFSRFLFPSVNRLPINFSLQDKVPAALLPKYNSALTTEAESVITAYDKLSAGIKKKNKDLEKEKEFAFERVAWNNVAVTLGCEAVNSQIDIGKMMPQNWANQRINNLIFLNANQEIQFIVQKNAFYLQSLPHSIIQNVTNTIDEDYYLSISVNPKEKNPQPSKLPDSMLTAESINKFESDASIGYAKRNKRLADAGVFWKTIGSTTFPYYHALKMILLMNESINVEELVQNNIYKAHNENELNMKKNIAKAIKEMRKIIDMKMILTPTEEQALDSTTENEISRIIKIFASDELIVSLCERILSITLKCIENGTSMNSVSHKRYKRTPILLNDTTYLKNKANSMNATERTDENSVFPDGDQLLLLNKTQTEITSNESLLKLIQDDNLKTLTYDKFKSGKRIKKSNIYINNGDSDEDIDQSETQRMSKFNGLTQNSIYSQSYVTVQNILTNHAPLEIETEFSSLLTSPMIIEPVMTIITTENKKMESSSLMYQLIKPLVDCFTDSIRIVTEKIDLVPLTPHLSDAFKMKLQAAPLEAKKNLDPLVKNIIKNIYTPFISATDVFIADTVEAYNKMKITDISERGIMIQTIVLFVKEFTISELAKCIASILVPVYLQKIKIKGERAKSLKAFARIMDVFEIDIVFAIKARILLDIVQSKIALQISDKLNEIIFIK